MAVPPYFGVLKSINFKQILRSSEEKVAASADYCILLITAGDEKREGKKNRQLLEGMANLFSAQSVGRVLFADYSAKAQFVIPKLNEIFGNEKYVNVDKEILNGMNDIMGSDENFATGQTKTKIYLELLSQARESFIQYFLYPEMKHISEEMGFKETPTPRFEEVTLESLNESKKLYNRLYELGALTPKELFNAYETNQLPVEEESLENQKAFKTQKKEKIYEPLIGNKAEVGRPTGTTAPKSKNTISPQGKASLAKIKENMPKMQELANLVSSVYKEKNSIARLSQNHKKLVDSMWERIMSVETVDNWGKEVVSKYIENPLSLACGGAQFDQICELMEEHELDLIAATILFHSMEKN
jgi:chemotaxis protein histidine kinase CheA